MNWRELSRANQSMLLTLPRAALWSIPVGYWLLMKLQLWWRFPVFFGSMHWNWYAIQALLPISAVCSSIAMERYASCKDSRAVTVLLMMFNIVSSVVSWVGTALIAIFHFAKAF
jgi:hypothetical protein